MVPPWLASPPNLLWRLNLVARAARASPRKRVLNFKAPNLNYAVQLNVRLKCGAVAVCIERRLVGRLKDETSW